MTINIDTSKFVGSIKNEVSSTVSEAASLEHSADNFMDISADPSSANAAIKAMHKVGYFQKYDTQLALASAEGFRPVKCLYKGDTKNGKKAEHTNSYVYIADTISSAAVEKQLPELMPFIIAYLQEQENSIVKDCHKKDSVFIGDTAVGMNAIIERLEASSIGNRLNKDMIDGWFTANMTDNLVEIFAGKLGITQDSSEQELRKLEAIIGTYKNKFTSLASPKISYAPADAERLIKALNLTRANEGTGAAIGSRLLARLERMINVDDSNFMDL